MHFFMENLMSLEDDICKLYKSLKIRDPLIVEVNENNFLDYSDWLGEMRSVDGSGWSKVYWRATRAVFDLIEAERLGEALVSDYKWIREVAKGSKNE